MFWIRPTEEALLDKSGGYSFFWSLFSCEARHVGQKEVSLASFHLQPGDEPAVRGI